MRAAARTSSRGPVRREGHSPRTLSRRPRREPPPVPRGRREESASSQRHLVRPPFSQRRLVRPPSPQRRLVRPPSPQFRLVRPPTPQRRLVRPPSPQRQLVRPPTPQRRLVRPPSPSRRLVRPPTSQCRDGDGDGAGPCDERPNAPSRSPSGRQRRRGDQRRRGCVAERLAPSPSPRESRGRPAVPWRPRARPPRPQSSRSRGRRPIAGAPERLSVEAEAGGSRPRRAADDAPRVRRARRASLGRRDGATRVPGAVRRPEGDSVRSALGGQLAGPRTRRRRRQSSSARADGAAASARMSLRGRSKAACAVADAAATDEGRDGEGQGWGAGGGSAAARGRRAGLLRERECEPRDYGRAEVHGKALRERVSVDGRRGSRRGAGRRRRGVRGWGLWLGVMVAL